MSIKDFKRDSFLMKNFNDLDFFVDESIKKLDIFNWVSSDNKNNRLQYQVINGNCDKEIVGCRFQ
jgi:hypothetical protein